MATLYTEKEKWIDPWPSNVNEAKYIPEVPDPGTRAEAVELIPLYATITVDLTSSKLSAEVGDEISGPFLEVIVDGVTIDVVDFDLVDVVENLRFGMLL